MDNKRHPKGSNIIIDPIKEVKATEKYIHMSPDKARQVLGQIRGLRYQEALSIFRFMSYESYKPILRVLYSAVANAQHDANLDPTTLVINKTFVDNGPTLKHYHSKAQDRTYQTTYKPSCHITIYVAPEINTVEKTPQYIVEKVLQQGRNKFDILESVVSKPNQKILRKTYSSPKSEGKISFKDFMNKIDPYILYKLGLSEKEQTVNDPGHKRPENDKYVVRLAMTVKVKDLNKKLEASKIKGFEKTFQIGEIIGCIGNKEIVMALQNDNNVQSVEASRPGIGFDDTSIAS